MKLSKFSKNLIRDILVKLFYCGELIWWRHHFSLYGKNWIISFYDNIAPAHRDMFYDIGAFPVYIAVCNKKTLEGRVT